MSRANIWEGHSRQRQTEVGGSDNRVSSRFQEELGVPRSLSSVCVLGAGSRKRWSLGGPRGSEHTELWGPM